MDEIPGHCQPGNGQGQRRQVHVKRTKTKQREDIASPGGQYGYQQGERLAEIQVGRPSQLLDARADQEGSDEEQQIIVGNIDPVPEAISDIQHRKGQVGFQERVRPHQAMKLVGPDQQYGDERLNAQQKDGTPTKLFHSTGILKGEGEPECGGAGGSQPRDVIPEDGGWQVGSGQFKRIRQRPPGYRNHQETKGYGAWRMAALPGDKRKRSRYGRGNYG